MKIFNAAPYTLVLFLFISCQQEEVLDKIYSEFPKAPAIEKGVVFNQNGLTSCDELFSDDRDICLIFSDSFEREKLVGAGIFNWKQAIMDNGYSGANVDAKIENTNHLGNVTAGEKAVLFRGRAGGSTHEIYLVSKALDLSEYEQVYIQFRYLPIQLEESITLSWNRKEVPENIRVDVCNNTDYECGLTGAKAYKRIRDNANWKSFAPDIQEFGQQYNLRNFTADDWKLGQFLINLDEFSDNKSKFVFKISVSMDEGYLCNNRAKLMEDGLILDEVILVGLKTSILF